MLLECQSLCTPAAQFCILQHIITMYTVGKLINRIIYYNVYSWKIDCHLNQ